MRATVSAAALVAASMIPGWERGPSAAEVTLEWEARGLRAPESVLYDARREVIYVSNMDGEASKRDGKGGIALLSADGEMLDADWVSGLNAPKGLALHEGKLYVADIDTLVVVDARTGAVVERHRAPDARFLNDTAVDGAGNVYVSDMQQAAIYRLQGGRLEKWLASDKRSLCTPNGLHAAEGRLVVGCWSVVVDEFDTVEPGRLKAVDLETRAVRPLGADSPVGHIDGVEPDGAGGYYLTDWLAGAVVHMDAGGKTATVLDLEQGSADHDFAVERGLLLVPMMNHDTVRAYRVTP